MSVIIVGLEIWSFLGQVLKKITFVKESLQPKGGIRTSGLGGDG